MRTAYELRERAEEIRTKADSFTILECKIGMLEIAEQYERDAIAADRRERGYASTSQAILRREDR